MTYDYAVALDAADPLASYRLRFRIGDDPAAYLDGNSLGRPPETTLARLREVTEHEWADRLISSWQERWLDLPTQVGDRLGAACLGATTGQTVIADSTTVNLYKAIHAGCSLRPDRAEVVVADTDFPTDRYVVESVAAARGLTVRWLHPDPVGGMTSEDLSDVLGGDTALVLLNHVDYRSGALLDLPALTAQVHTAGAVVLWDLCHSVGVVPIGLDVAGADLAVGCTYKYLNAGPGAPAFLYVAGRHLPTIVQPIPGWWSASDMFAMAPTYDAAPSIRKMLSGTADVLGIVAVDEGVRLVAEAGIEAIRAKAVLLTEAAIGYVDDRLAPLGVRLLSPRDPDRRGGHVSIGLDDAEGVTADLVAAGVVPDFRNPDQVRLGLSPLTTSFTELWQAMETLHDVLVKRSAPAR